MNLRLLQRRPAETAATGRQVQVRVLDGSYLPDSILAEAGVPLRIVFRREETSPCSEQVVFPAFGKSATLPVDKDVAIDLLPDEPGEYEFTCGMGMLTGKLVVMRPAEVPE